MDSFDIPTPAEETSPPPRKKLALHWQIVIGLALGAVLGLAANAIASRPGLEGDPWDLDQNGVHDRLDWWVGNVVEPLGRVFVRLILMVVLPLVFSALVLGVVGIGDARHLGRLGLKTLGLTALLSSTAVFLGIALVNGVQPGRMMPAAQRQALCEKYRGKVEDAVSQARRAKPFSDALLDLIPENPLQEAVGAVDGSSKGNGMLALMLFALVVGVAASQKQEQCQTFLAMLEGINQIAMTVIGYAMRIAPFGVACLVFSMTARLGWSLFAPLGAFVGVVLAGLAIQLFVVYPIVLWMFSPIRPADFFRGVSDAMATAFGTSSSNATLPTSLRVAEENLRLAPQVSRFVLTVGATGNQNGTGLYEGVVVLFLAQVFQIELSLAQQASVLLMAVLAGVGTAGIPGGSLPMIVVVLQTVGVPADGIAIILGIDRLLDMCRTVVNVTGDLAIAACVD